MLDAILDSYTTLQNKGFVWDLRYGDNVYKDIEFVIFTPFFKVDGDEADKLCGKYTSRTHRVAQLCRYCECPTKQTDKPLRKDPFKEVEKIQALVEAGDDESLRLLSQQNIQNALYKIRFGSHKAKLHKLV